MNFHAKMEYASLTLCSEHHSRFNLFGGKLAKAFNTSSERAKNITVFPPYILSKEGAQTPLHQFTPPHRNPLNKEQGLQIEVNEMLKSIISLSRSSITGLLLKHLFKQGLQA